MYIYCQTTDLDDDTLNYSIRILYKDNENASPYWHTVVNWTGASSYYFDISNVTPQTNVDISCNVTDGIDYVYKNPNGTVVITQRSSADILYVGYRPYVSAGIPYTLGISCDLVNERNISIYGTYFDCNNDGHYEYYHDYSKIKPKSVVNYFECITYDVGLIKVSGGCIVSKPNKNFTWTQFCYTNDDYDLCKVKLEAQFEVFS